MWFFFITTNGCMGFDKGALNGFYTHSLHSNCEGDAKTIDITVGPCERGLSTLTLIRGNLIYFLRNSTALICCHTSCLEKYFYFYSLWLFRREPRQEAAEGSVGCLWYALLNFTRPFFDSFQKSKCSHKVKKWPSDLTHTTQLLIWYTFLVC